MWAATLRTYVRARRLVHMEKPPFRLNQDVSQTFALKYRGTASVHNSALGILWNINP